MLVMKIILAYTVVIMPQALVTTCSLAYMGKYIQHDAGYRRPTQDLWIGPNGGAGTWPFTTCVYVVHVVLTAYIGGAEVKINIALKEFLKRDKWVNNAVKIV